MAKFVCQLLRSLALTKYWQRFGLDLVFDDHLHFSLNFTADSEISDFALDFVVSNFNLSTGFKTSNLSLETETEAFSTQIFSFNSIRQVHPSFPLVVHLLAN
jgi:hypothetical protein